MDYFVAFLVIVILQTVGNVAFMTLLSLSLFTEASLGFKIATYVLYGTLLIIYAIGVLIVSCFYEKQNRILSSKYSDAVSANQ